jgi:hypothetical protein
LEENKKENILSRETFDRLLHQLNLSTTLTAKGKKGESTFYEISNTFKDFNDFRIQDKHLDAGLGDFHLHFENFDVLVDAKNYKDVVNKKQRDKIKSDLLRNEHIEFAWLVSLNSGIAMYDRLPIMHEFINTKQCVIYINNLLSFENPEQILRISWLFCCQLHRIISLTNVDDDNIVEINELKNKHYKMYDKIKNMKVLVREINSSINMLKNQVDLINLEIIHILELETGKLLEQNSSAFDDWWNENVEYTDEEFSLTSNDMWIKFKKQNKTIISDFNVSYDDFKKYILSKIHVENYSIKSKGGPIILNNYKYKNNIININENVIKENVIKENVIKENVIKENVIKENVINVNENIKQTMINVLQDKIHINMNNEKNKKKSKSSKQNMYYINEEIDNKILNEYSNLENNIISIAKDNNLEVYKIVSILIKHKIINTRNECRGYDIYKESDEYKLKINKS